MMTSVTTGVGDFWDTLSQAMSPLLMLAIILLAGMAGGKVARRMRAPEIIGNLAAGILLSPSCLNVFGTRDVTQVLSPISTFGVVSLPSVWGLICLTRAFTTRCDASL
jgi:Kef-type K+ transport system membrane component KefB